MEGNLRFKIDSGSPLVGTKFTIFALFYFVFLGNFQIQISHFLHNESKEFASKTSSAK